jgi:hypothetical protein
VKRAAVIASLVLLAVALLIGGVAASRDADEPEQSSPATTEAPLDDRYPLTAGPTSASVQNAVFERAYSECASTKLELLASKYKVADTSAQGVAAVVGRAWASYFKAGPDAVPDGRDGCLQGQGDRGEAP